MIPVLDVMPLFGPPSPLRDRVDAQIGEAAEQSGFFTVVGPTPTIPTDAATRAALLRVFELSAEQQQRLWRQFYAQDHANTYRGWNPAQGEVAVDLYDLGPDVAHALTPDQIAEDDPLLSPTPMPPNEALPGWADAVRAYYLAMERLGAVMMRSVARILGLPEQHFEAHFAGGISTLRLMRYQFPPGFVVADPADPQMPRRGEHVDSGFVTLLCQNGVAGLSAKSRAGDWMDVPPVDGHVAVNFGGLLERWTGGRIRATPHRVVSQQPTRFSIPFFYEPRADAVIRPLPLRDAEQFEPFAYGDHLWKAMSKFPNFAGIADLRAPRGVRSDVA